MGIKIGSYYKFNSKPEVAFKILDETEKEYIIKGFFKTGDSFGTFEKKGFERMISKGVLKNISEEEAFLIVL